MQETDIFNISIENQDIIDTKLIFEEIELNKMFIKNNSLRTFNVDDILFSKLFIGHSKQRIVDTHG